VRTLAESFGFKPTKFLPNGCGPSGWFGKLVPDEIGGANFDDCCDIHDLGYHVGKGGWRGLLTEKPFIDYKLAVCMDKRFQHRSLALLFDGKKVRGALYFVGTAFVPFVYFIGLTLLGWTPLTWPWKERPMPSHEDLERLLAHNKEN